MVGTHGKFLQRSYPLLFSAPSGTLLIKHLSVYWTVDAQYSFGWFGPVICAYLFFIRWITRPLTGPAPSPGAEWVFWIACLAFLPTWLVEQPNPDWRLITWLLTLEIVILSLCAIYFVGGRSWLRHFAFSTCFILTTLPWPGGAEAFITQSLMQVATWVTVEFLKLSNIAALQHGNVIEVKTGLLGINEACSGVRSLQATVMVSLFLGELYRATWQRKVVFLLSGVVIAFLCNVGRTYFLCWENQGGGY
jgi:exosortase